MGKRTPNPLNMFPVPPKKQDEPELLLDDLIRGFERLPFGGYRATPMIEDGDDGAGLMTREGRPRELRFE